jgi:glutathione S-transferase
MTRAETIAANLVQEQKRHAESKTVGPKQKDHYRLWQSEASPFSYKVAAFMNYKAIPYKKVVANMMEMEWLNNVAGQSIVTVMLSPDDQVMQDSTPMMTFLESEHPAIKTVPNDAKLAFLMWLIEEFSDEYMPRICMYTRWGNEQNRRAISHHIARTLVFASLDTEVKDLAPVFVKRQTGFDVHLGLSGNEVQKSMDEQIDALLSILEEHFKHYQFLLGFRPSMADFALYGVLKVHLYEDPQSREIMETKGPRTCNWLLTIANFGDMRGCAGQAEFGDWVDLEGVVPRSLQALLGFIGQTYIPFAKACAEASLKKSKTFQAEIFGVNAVFSTHQYRVWSFEQLQLNYDALADIEKTQLGEALAEAQVMPALMENGIFHNGLFDGFTPPFIKDGIPDARIKHIREKVASNRAGGS